MYMYSCISNNILQTGNLNILVDVTLNTFYVQHHLYIRRDVMGDYGLEIDNRISRNTDQFISLTMILYIH